MRVRQSLPALVGAVAMVLGMSTAATAAPSAAANPCGYYATSNDSYYNHCTNDGSYIIIEVRTKAGKKEQCVGPGITWLGTRKNVSNAWYAGRTC